MRFNSDQQDDLPPQVLTEHTPSPLLSTAAAAASGSTSPIIIEEKRNFDNGDEAYLEKAINFCNKVRNYLCNDEDQLQLMKIMYYYGIETIDKIDMRKMISQLLENHPKLMNEFDKLIDHYSNPKRFDSQEKKETEEQIKVKPTMEEEVTNPSYYRRPASKRKICEMEVLNDEWVLKTPNVISKERERNEYEKNMITCEDDRYKFDMVCATFRSAFENVKRLINAICLENVKLEAPIEAERYLSVHNLRCIENLYGEEDGEDILKLLATKPNETLVTIFVRLNQKMEEFENQYKSTFKEQWAKVYADNLHKSMGFE